MELPGSDPKIHSKFTKEKTQQSFAIARLTIGDKLKNLVSKSDEKNAIKEDIRIYDMIL